MRGEEFDMVWDLFLMKSFGVEKGFLASLERMGIESEERFLGLGDLKDVEPRRFEVRLKKIWANSI